MSDLKRYTIIGVIFVLITGTIAHFIYDLSGGNMIAGFFFPVNESIWEHMKLVFFPMLLYSFYANKKMKHTNPCITSSFLFGTLAGTFLIPILYYTYSGILGYHLLWLDLLTFVLSVFAAFWIAYRATLSCRFVSIENIIKIAVFLIAVAFFAFTYFPPDIALFADPTE